MIVPRSVLDGCTAQLNALSAAGQRLVLDALANARWRTVAELRAVMSEAMGQVCSVVAGDAAILASEMYDDVRELCAGERLGALPEGVWDPAATEGAVRALVERVVDDEGQTARFGRALAARVDYEAKRAAGEAVMRLSAQDELRPGWARVPSGAETCPFCIMLASRGFVYHRDATAGAGGHYHANCDCRIVPGFEGTEVEGYDPVGLYDRYRDCADALDEGWLWRSYGALPQSERDGMSFDDFKTKQVLAEMRTRDPLWLNKGITGKITKQSGAKPLPKENQLALSLADHGFNVEFIKEQNRYKVKTPDALLNGIPYEFKIPEKYGSKTVKNQFKNATGKGTGCLVISCEQNGADVRSVMEDVKELFDTSDYSDISQVIVLGKEGELMRLRRT